MALKGPADRMLAVARPRVVGPRRRPAVRRTSSTSFVLDTVDAALAPAVEALGLRPVVTDTIMGDDASRARLAGEVLAAVTG